MFSMPIIGFLPIGMLGGDNGVCSTCCRMLSSSACSTSVHVLLKYLHARLRSETVVRKILDYLCTVSVLHSSAIVSPEKHTGRDGFLKTSTPAKNKSRQSSCPACLRIFVHIRRSGVPKRRCSTSHVAINDPHAFTISFTTPSGTECTSTRASCMQLQSVMSLFHRRASRCSRASVH